MPRRDPLRSASLALKAVGSPLPDALVRPAGAFVVAVFVEHALKVVRPEDGEMIETLPSDGADHAFAMRVRPGRHHGCADHPHASTLGHVVENGSELGIMVSEEELRPLPEERQLPKLLGQPVGARSRGRCDVENATGCQVRDDEDEVAPEPNVTRLEQVTGPDASRPIPEER